MITISLCMILKNEEAVLARCLDSVADLMDEIILVDTGSTDRTKEIAARYTHKIYDYVWQDDFADARNFSFSKASMEYIYTADADEVLDEANRKRLRILKEAMLPEVEIVQMKYLTKNDFNTVLNFREEYRPKLFRRLRTFTWIDPIHETVRLDPVVFDSDIEITHLPQSLHSERDFKGFQKAFARDGRLSPKLHSMYARELLMTGTPEQLAAGAPVFEHTLQDGAVSDDMRREASCVLARHYRLTGNSDEFFKLTLKDMAADPCAEICYELGCYFRDREDYEEAALWFYNAAYETGSILDIRTSGKLPLEGLALCYEARGYEEQAEEYRNAASTWQLPKDISSLG